MKITIIGTGYVGLVTGTCLANLGNEVLCLDKDKEKIALLGQGIVPIYEPGLKELFDHNMKLQRLLFTDDKKAAIEHGEIIFICVGTPPKSNGEADLSHVLEAALDIGRHIESYKVIVNKSTVPVGTAELVRKEILSANKAAQFDMASNPEFLREGAAVKDFEVPDRIIIGTDSQRARLLLEKLYSSVARVGKPIMFTDISSSELIKYASNAMLAARISFMNQLSFLCEKTGANIKEVARGMGLDSRIGPRFLQAGVGYGGSCFPKDVTALAQSMRQHGLKTDLFDAVHEVNERQKAYAVERLEKELDLQGSKIAVWGLSYKPKTDDIRSAPALSIVRALQSRGALVNACDPAAIENAKQELSDVKFFKCPYDAAKGCDALMLITEWSDFRSLDMQKVAKSMRKPIIFDGRNIYNPDELKAFGFTYIGVGR